MSAVSVKISLPCPMPTESAKNTHQPETFVGHEGESPALDHTPFDEMNLVELPFSLLTRNTDGIYEIPLSADGKSKLACLHSSEYGLPNSLAPRVVLGLMWMWKSECDNATHAFTVKVRELVVRYIYPDRFKHTWPNGDVLQAVERQINCIANSRIHTDRWWDHERKQRIKANISIIDGVTVLDEGGPNRPRVLRVTWGMEFFESMVRRYTKPLDAKLVQRLEHPIDLQLYRLLDRQLTAKPRQQYNSIVDLARYKLGMQGKRLNCGGRTASSYVAQKLTEAIHRLSTEQFTVRMTIDRSVVPFTVTFDRLVNPSPKQPHEIRDDDGTGDLVREFLFYAHGVPREQKRTRIAEADRAAAKEWLLAYGAVKAKWMIKHGVKKQKELGGPNILIFRGLQRYEGVAAGAYEQHVRDLAAREDRQVAEELDAHWSTYCRSLIELHDARTSAEELAALEVAASEALGREKPDSPRFITKLLVRSRLHATKLARMNGLSEEEFRAHRSLRELRAALIARHAVDLLALPSREAEGEGALP